MRLKEDFDLFGPGADLLISLIAVFLIILVLQSKYLYDATKNNNGNFKIASVSFPAAQFMVKPVDRFNDQNSAIKLVQVVVSEYNKYKSEYPYMFIIGHSSEMDDPNANNKTYEDRLQRNWIYAGRRAVVVASEIQKHLNTSEKQNIIVSTTGELDLKNTRQPLSQENAWVEIVFAKEWKWSKKSMSSKARNELSTDYGTKATLKPTKPLRSLGLP